MSAQPKRREDGPQFHPLAEIFPLMDGDEFHELVQSIRTNGLMHAITMHEGMILDGRNRFRACGEAGVDPRFEDFTGSDPVQFVLAKNVNRRHLNPSQRALIVAGFVTTQSHQRADFARKKAGREISLPAVVSVSDAATLAGVDPSTITDAKRVLAEGTPDEIAAVKKGKTSVSTIANAMRAKKSAPERAAHRAAPLAARGRNPERIRREQLDAVAWNQLKDALINLSGLPLPSDVAALVAKSPKRRKAVDERLAVSLQWLTEFFKCLPPR